MGKLIPINEEVRASLEAPKLTRLERLKAKLKDLLSAHPERLDPLGPLPNRGVRPSVDFDPIAVSVALSKTPQKPEKETSRPKIGRTPW